MRVTKVRQFGGLLLAFFICVLINLLALDISYRFDLTTEEIYSLSSKASQVLEAIDQPVHIVFAYDVRSRAQRDSVRTLRNIAKKSNFVSIELFDPVLEPALAEANGIRFSGSGLFRSDDRQVLFDDPTEVGFINALVRVTSPNLGLLCFSDGHLESNPYSLHSHDHSEAAMTGHNHSTGGRPISLHERHGMGIARESLEHLGFTVEQRVLLKDKDSLEGCSALIIASPLTPFESREIKNLKKYIEKAGRVLFLLEPDANAGLEELLREFDVEFSGTRIKDPEKHFWADAFTPAVSNYPRHRVTRNLPLTFFPGVGELRPSGSSVDRNLRTEVILATSSNSVLDDKPEDAKSRAIGIITKDLDSGSVLLVLGDGDFATNSYFDQLGNGALFLNLVSELSQSHGAIDLLPRQYKEGRLSLSSGQLNIVFLTNILMGPLLLLAVGFFIWKKRK